MFVQLSHRLVVASFAALLLSPSTSVPSRAAESRDAANSAAGDRFFAVFYAHQSEDNRIEMSHTFAAFVRTTGGSQPRVAETRTISWFPVSEIVAVARPTESGENRSLEKTLAWADERHLQVFVTGPFEIQAELYHRAAQRAELLDHGGLKYKAFDRFTRSSAVNCVHALTDIVPEPALLNSGGARGQDATLLAVRHLHRFFVTDAVATDAGVVIKALNLARFSQPTSNMFAGGGPAPVVR